MNEIPPPYNQTPPPYTPLGDAPGRRCADMNECMRRNPTATLLVALGAGLVIGLVVRALRPEPTPRQQALRLLDELGGRLRSAVEPAVGKVGSLTQDGVEALQEGEARLERLVRDTAKRLRNLFP